jgi:single-strand DNA-binding protein
MNNTNLTIQIGNLVNDPELTFTPSAAALCKFNIAVNDDYADKKDVSFFDIITWNKTAEICNTYLNKGAKVCVTGKLKQERWDTPEGQKRSRIVIVASKVEFLRTEKKENTPVNKPPVENPFVNNDENVDSIPF